MDTAGLKERQLAAAREKLDIRRRNVSHDIESIVYDGNAGQALVIHNL